MTNSSKAQAVEDPLQPHYAIDEGCLPDCLSSSDIQKLQDKEIVKKKKGSDERYKFTFVGVICSGNHAICVLPKKQQASDDDGWLRLMRCTISGMRRYHTSGKSRIDGEDNSQFLTTDPHNSLASKLGLYVWLLDDYHEHGLIRKRVRKKARNHIGQVDWSRTVATVDPLISAGNVIYIDPVMHRKQIDRNSMLSRVHKFVLENIDPFYLNILDAEALDLSHEPFESLLTEDRDMLLNALSVCLREAFADREIRLIKILQVILGREAYHDSNDTLSIYGVRKFEHIWEDMINQVFGNEKSDQKNIPEMPYSQWKNMSGTNIHTGRRLIPDCVRLTSDTLWILDAKYYSLSFDAKCLGGKPPGVQDIVKQFCYEIALEAKVNKIEKKKRNNFKGNKRFKPKRHLLKLKKKPDKNINVENYLIFPGDVDVYAGSVSMDGLFPDKVVKCIQLSFEQLANDYVQGVELNPDQMKGRLKC